MFRHPVSGASTHKRKYSTGRRYNYVSLDSVLTLYLKYDAVAEFAVQIRKQVTARYEKLPFT